jgi:hypothetical protein
MLKAVNKQPKLRRQRLAEKRRIEPRKVVLGDIAQLRFCEGIELALFHASLTLARPRVSAWQKLER